MELNTLFYFVSFVLNLAGESHEADTGVFFTFNSRCEKQRNYLKLLSFGTVMLYTSLNCVLPPY